MLEELFVRMELRMGSNRFREQKVEGWGSILGNPGYPHRGG